MNKRKLHHIWRKLQPISYWYFLAAFIISATVAVLALRHNNLTAISLRNQVLQTDQQNGDVTSALNKLRSYVYSHMNTNLDSGPGAIYPPIQLKYTYNRLVQAEQTRVDAVNSKIYTDAQNYCQQTVPNGFSGRFRLSCIDTYVTSHGTTAKPIPTALYEFDFVSPFWSSDLAGWSIVVSAIFLLLFIVRFGLQKWLKYELKQNS